MASYLTSDTLIASVVRRAAIPQSQVTFQTADFLAFANEELAIGIVPSVLQFHQEFFVNSSTVPLVANVSSYEIPSRAIGNKLRSVFYVDTNGNYREMARISPDDLPYFAKRDYSGFPGVFYLQNNNVVLVPSIGSNVNGSLYLSYFQRPNQMVDSSRVANITAIDYATGDITVGETPSVFANGLMYDLVETNGGHKCVAQDVSATAVNPTTNVISFGAGNVPASLSIGDWVCLAGETYIPQIPDELHPVLAQRIACRCLEALDDAQGLQNANQKLLEMEQKIGNVIDNRTEGQPQKVNNLRSPLHSSKMSYRGWT